MEKEPAAAPGKKGRLKLKIAAASVAVVFSLVVGEIMARLVRHEDPTALADEIPDEACQFRLAPDRVRSYEKVSTRINALGFRDEEDFPEKKPAGETRVLFVGDSFMYGASLKQEDVLPKQCEAALAAHGTKVRSVTLCCPGWGTKQELGALERYGLRVEPDLVVLCFFVGNDVLECCYEDHSSDRFVVDDDHTLRFVHREASLRKRILMKSRLFQIIEATDTYQRIAHGKAKSHAPLPQARNALVDEYYYEEERLRLEQWRRGAADNPPLQAAWELCGKAFRAFVAAARAKGAPVAVVIIPDEVQVDAAVRAEVCRRFALDEKDYDLDLPQRKVSELARAADVACVDTLPAFREQGSRGGLYIEKNTHWNARGHALAATLLAPVVEKALAKEK